MIETLAKQAAVNLFHEEGRVADMNDSEKLDLILNQMGTVNERLGGIDKRLDKLEGVNAVTNKTAAGLKSM